MQQDKQACPKMEVEERKALTVKLSIKTMTGNFIMAIFKVLAGVFANSTVMLTDGVHSFADVFSTAMVMIGVHLSSRHKNEKYPYGHERMESIVAIILASLLVVTGIGIGFHGFERIMQGKNLKPPGLLALIVAGLSILAEEIMYWMTKRVAKRTESEALMADAWHHRADALSSVCSLVGIGGAMLGIPVLDPIASMLLCLFIFKIAYDIFREAVSKVADRSCDDATLQELRALILAVPGVMAMNELKTRQFGNRCYVDIDICADSELSLFCAHTIAQQVKESVECQFEAVVGCMVQVNPLQNPDPSPEELPPASPENSVPAAKKNRPPV